MQPFSRAASARALTAMEAAQKQGVTAPEHPGDRETPDYTFKTDTGRTVTREEAAQIAKDAGQTIKEPVNGKLHSGDIEQPKTEQPDIRPKVDHRLRPCGYLTASSGKMLSYRGC